MGKAISPTAIVSGTSSDSHMWNLVFLELTLRELGFDVANLGVCVPDQVLLDACLDHWPDLVVLGTLNGHGYDDGLRIIQKLRVSMAPAGTRFVIGGKLNVAGQLSAGQRDSLLRAGFDGVFEGDAAIDSFLRFVAATTARATVCR